MKITPLSPARPRCRAVRFWSALTEREPEHHVQHCAECRAYFAAAAGLESRLTRAAAQPPAAVPADLERGILRAVATTRAEVTAAAAFERRPAPLARWITGGGLALAAAAALAILITQRETRPPAAGAAVGLAPQEVTALASSAAQLSARWWNSVVPSAGTAIQNNPLQQEAASVYAAAQSAIDFLALNFLPEDAIGSTTPPVDSPSERNI